MLQSGSAGGSNSPATLSFRQCLSRVRTGNIARASSPRPIPASPRALSLPIKIFADGERGDGSLRPGPSRVRLNESPPRIIRKHSVLFSPILFLFRVRPSSLRPLCLPRPTRDRECTIRGRFVIAWRTDMADRFWRLALCWICIAGLAGANGERRAFQIQSRRNAVSARFLTATFFEIINSGESCTEEYAA